MTIRVKVIVVRGLMLCSTIGLGLFSLQRLGTVNEAGADVRDNWLPSVEVLGRISAVSERYRALQASFILAGSDQRKAGVEAELNAALAEKAAAQTEYEPMVTPGAERGLADDFTRKWNVYAAATSALAQSARSNDLSRAKNILKAPRFVTGIKAA